MVMDVFSMGDFRSLLTVSSIVHTATRFMPYILEREISNKLSEHNFTGIKSTRKMFFLTWLLQLLTQGTLNYSLLLSN